METLGVLEALNLTMLNQLFQIAIMNDTNQALGCCGIPARPANAQSMVLFYNKQRNNRRIAPIPYPSISNGSCS
jgi:hypothetical protein